MARAMKDRSQEEIENALANALMDVEYIDKCEPCKRLHADGESAIEAFNDDKYCRGEASGFRLILIRVFLFAPKK